MKKILILIGLAAALLPASVKAQGRINVPQTLGIANTVLANTASNYTSGNKMQVGGQTTVAIQVKCNSDATNVQTGGLVLVFNKSVDGTTYESATNTAFATTQNGTNTLTTIYTLSTSNCAWISLTTISNLNGVANITNLSVKYGQVIGNGS